MLRNSLSARLIACAAGAMLLVPALPVVAAPQSVQQVRQGNDLILSGGKISGKLLDSNGKPVSGAAVNVSKDGKLISRTTTKSDGTYSLTNLKSGSYTMAIGEGQFPVRLWNQDSAPASAKTQLNVSQTAVRGQFVDDCGLPIWTNVAIAGVAAAALTIGIISLTDDDDTPASP